MDFKWYYSRSQVILEDAQYCTVPPAPVEVEEVVVTEDQQAALTGTGDYTPVEIEESPSSGWSQEDSWVLIGAVILAGIAYYLYHTVGGEITEWWFFTRYSEDNGLLGRWNSQGDSDSSTTPTSSLLDRRRGSVAR